MATTKTEKTHAGAFLVSEEENFYSRDQVTIAHGQDLEAGAVLGQVTATEEYVAVDPDTLDGRETACAVLFNAVDATDAATQGVAITRAAQVVSDRLDFGDLDAGEIATAKAELKAVGIIVRESI